MSKSIPTKEQLLDTMGDFSWLWGKHWFIETEEYGNFVWLDPDYDDGDNTVRPYAGSLQNFLDEKKMRFGRDKGIKLIRNKLGTEWALILDDKLAA